MDHTERFGEGGLPAPHYSAIGIGHSHLTAIQIAYNHRKATDQHAQLSNLQFIQLLDPILKPNVISDKGANSLNETLRREILRALGQASGNVSILLSLSGNEYHFIGMFNQPRRFDFVLPNQPDLPLSDRTEIIPPRLLEARLRKNVHAVVEFVPLLKRLVGERTTIYSVQSPPPIPDSDYIMKGNSAFRKQLDEFGVAPPLLRYKLWALQSHIYEQELTDAGTVFLSNPPLATDEAGFMRPEGWHPDGVHASAWFGELILMQLEGVLDSRSSGTYES
jgi:hypothetical protein